MDVLGPKKIVVFGLCGCFLSGLGYLYDAKGWDGAAFALTLFSVAFVGTRLRFPNGINRLGGLNVAMICFGVEIIGLLLVAMALLLTWRLKKRPPPALPEAISSS